MGYILGMMSGTSFDGVDAVLYEPSTQHVLTSLFLPYSKQIKALGDVLIGQKGGSFEQLASFTHLVNKAYLEAATSLLQHLPSHVLVEAVGCHGQTISHSPNSAMPYSYQLINGAALATQLHLPVVCDFRSADISLGGQGAPLAPVFHQALFKLSQTTVILNIGGIANITYLDSSGELRGFDSGPGNGLMDEWAGLQLGLRYDDRGQLAKQGKVIVKLLDRLLADPFFEKKPPKSLDKHYLSLAKLKHLKLGTYAVADVQATFLMLTVHSIVNAIKDTCPACDRLIVCGGGVHNDALMGQLQNFFPQVLTSDAIGYPSDYLEAMLIAWLTKKRLNQEPVDLTTITGASRPAVLGALYLP